mmetsp:Transcript_57750/g.101461  ORF Transcript_57750/g.101461 Transcript_57750/m.101461 type:complete len:318 (-) Transcript_57750:519-1472(-)
MWHGLRLGTRLAFEDLGRNRLAQKLPSGLADLCDAQAIAHAVDGGFAEVHDVARQGAGLVGENVRHLSELLVQRHGAHDRGGVQGRVIHIQIGVHKHTLCEAYKRHGHIQRHGDHRGMQQQLVEKLNDPHLAGVLVPAQVPVALDVLGAVEDHLSDGACEAHPQQHHDDAGDLLCGHQVQVGRLHSGRHIALHDLHVVAGVQHQTHHPVRRAKHAATEDHILRINGHSAGVGDALGAQNAGEGVDVVVRVLHLDRTGEAAQVTIGLDLAEQRRHDSAYFQVGFTVQRLGLHVAHALRLRWVRLGDFQYHHIGRHNLT